MTIYSWTPNLLTGPSLLLVIFFDSLLPCFESLLLRSSLRSFASWYTNQIEGDLWNYCLPSVDQIKWLKTQKRGPCLGCQMLITLNILLSIIPVLYVVSDLKATDIALCVITKQLFLFQTRRRCTLKLKYKKGLCLEKTGCLCEVL